MFFKRLPGTENPCVPGSNPGPGTSKLKGLQLFGCDPLFCLWSIYGPSAYLFAPELTLPSQLYSISIKSLEESISPLQFLIDSYKQRVITNQQLSRRAPQQSEYSGNMDS